MVVVWAGWLLVLQKPQQLQRMQSGAKLCQGRGIFQKTRQATKAEDERL